MSVKPEAGLGILALRPWAPYVLGLLRIVAALLLLEYGTLKLFHIPAAPDFEMQPIYYVAGVFELVGGTLLALGLFTRPVAFILSGEMAVAYFHSHAPHSFFPLVNRGELAVLFCFTFLYFVFAGGGAWSLDKAVLKRD
jgi:putative oxidoreductase